MFVTEVCATSHVDALMRYPWMGVEGVVEDVLRDKALHSDVLGGDSLGYYGVLYSYLFMRSKYTAGTDLALCSEKRCRCVKFFAYLEVLKVLETSCLIY